LCERIGEKDFLSILYVGINKLRKPRDVFIYILIIIGMKIHPISVLFNLILVQY
jgi:hypothetical protein